MTLVSAPPGSGKTVLLRSWIDAVGLGDRVAWVSVERGERDAQRFWLSVVERCAAPSAATGFVERLSPAPAFHGEVVVERLLSELASLDEPVVLVIDDLHELCSADALRVARALPRAPAARAAARARRRARTRGSGCIGCGSRAS